MGEIEDKLAARGIKLPATPTPMGFYVPAVRVGSLLFISGQLPRLNDQLHFVGKVDSELTAAEAKEAARLAALNAVAAIKMEVGELDRVKRIVKLTGSVASSPGFTGQPEVVNGASELLNEVFGGKGRHARMSVGVAELPGRAPVAVELIVEVE